ncbi:MAG: glycosyltransferase family 39 protein [Deltaproteobacteria bacterium]|nr:glycosyltransferase family 39 protein [Deltaproteobacteria bacterium]
MLSDHPINNSASDAAPVAKIIIFSLAVRWIYCLILYGLMGNAGITGVDSGSLLPLGESFAKALVNGTLHGWQWVGTEPLIMPLFTWLVAINVAIFGKWAVLSYVLSQCVLDTATCYLVYRIAREVYPAAAIPALVAAAINPTQIVLSGFFYTDTPFAFFAALFLLGSAGWLKVTTWRAALLIGIGLGGGLLIRPVMAPWAPVVLVFFLVSATLRRKLSLQCFGQIVLAGLVFCVCAGAIMMRNATDYGAWSLTPQSGMHLSRWIVPLVREAKDGTPWAITADDTERRTAERFGPVTKNPFEQSQRYRAVAMEDLSQLGLAAIAKAWGTGAAINLAAPSVILSPPVSQLPRTGFYATRGDTALEKIENFLFRSDNAIYAWILLAGIAGVATMRLLQLAGAFALLRAGANPWIMLLFAGWCLYILLANGPIASPKYRLPIEPVLTVLTGIGIAALLRGRRRSG